MEPTDPLYPVMEGAVAARQTLVEAASLEEQQIEAAQAASTEYSARVAALKQTVSEHPDLSDIHKAAWLEAIERSPDDPTQIEQTANKLVDIIEKLQAAFSESDMPVVEFQRAAIHGRPHISRSYKTAGTGAIINNMNFEVAKVAVVYEDHPEPQELNIWLSDLNVVACSAEDVDETQTEESLKDPKSSGDIFSSLIIGEEAIVRFAERLYGSEVDDGGSIMEQLVEASAELGIDLEQRVEVMRQDLERQREAKRVRTTEDTAQWALNRVIFGQGGDEVLATLRTMAEEEKISLSEVLERMAELRESRVAQLDLWLDNAKRSEQGQLELTEQPN